MLVIDLIYNLAILVTACTIADYVDNRWSRTTLTGVVLQGFLFGGVAMLAILKPFVLSSGIIFDGRSVVLSLGALFFGPVTGIIAGIIAVITRLFIGGAGTLMGVSVIFSSVTLGVLLFYRRKKHPAAIKSLYLLLFGVLVHSVMILLMFALPFGMSSVALQTVGLTVIIAYPIATVVIGRILSNQENRIRLMANLTSSENKFRCLVENAFEAIYLMENRHYSYVNPAFCKLTGYSQEEMTSKDFEFNRLLTEKSHVVVEERYRARERGEAVPQNYISQIRTKGGLVKDVEVSTVSMGNGKKVQVMGIIHDISRRLEAEKENAIKNYELKQLNEDKDKLFSIISHDLRSPFGAFTGLLEIMADKEENLSIGEMRRMSINILKSAKTLNFMLENLLDWSRLKRGTLVSKIKDIDLLGVVNDAIEEIRDAAIRKDIKITNLVSEKLIFPTDEKIVRSVFRNLLTNSIKFSYHGGTIAVGAIKHSNSVLQFSVSDNGIGMTQDTLAKLFTFSYNLTSAGTDNEHGTGLGLAICRDLLGEHGGEIWAESEPGKGSTFYFTLSSNNARVSQAPNEE